MGFVTMTDPTKNVLPSKDGGASPSDRDMETARRLIRAPNGQRAYAFEIDIALALANARAEGREEAAKIVDREQAAHARIANDAMRSSTVRDWAAETANECWGIAAAIRGRPTASP